MELEFQAGLDIVGQWMKNSPDKMQFIKHDGSALIQLGVNLLAINQLRPYPHWDGFKNLIIKIQEVYYSVAHPDEYSRIGLRYINRIEIAQQDIKLADYFNIQPKIPSEIPSVYKTLFLRMEIPYPNDNGTLVLNFGTAPNPIPNLTSLILDIDFVTLSASELSIGSAIEWIEQAHSRIETAFEGCITDVTRALFEESVL